MSFLPVPLHPFLHSIGSIVFVAEVHLRHFFVQFWPLSTQENHFVLKDFCCNSILHMYLSIYIFHLGMYRVFSFQGLFVPLLCERLWVHDAHTLQLLG